MTDLVETLSVWSSRPIVQIIVLCSSFSVCGKLWVQYKSSVCSVFFVLNMLFSSRFVNQLLNWVQNRCTVIGKHSSLSDWESEEKKHRYWLEGDLLHPGHMGFQVCMLLKETDILLQSSQSAIQQCAFLVESVPRFSTHLLKCSLCFPHSQMHTLLARWLLVPGIKCFAVLSGTSECPAMGDSRVTLLAVSAELRKVGRKKKRRRKKRSVCGRGLPCS